MFLLIIKLFVEVVLPGAWPLNQLHRCLVLRKLNGAILTTKYRSEHLWCFIWTVTSVILVPDWVLDIVGIWRWALFLQSWRPEAIIGLLEGIASVRPEHAGQWLADLRHSSIGESIVGGTCRSTLTTLDTLKACAAIYSHVRKVWIIHDRVADRASTFSTRSCLTSANNRAELGGIEPDAVLARPRQGRILLKISLKVITL